MEILREIFSVIKSNLTRTILTALSVVWGIFMLILLLGAGSGLQNGAMSSFRSNSKNRTFVAEGRTTMPYKGFKEGRKIQLKNEDYTLIDNSYDQIDNITKAFNVWGGNLVKYNTTYSWFSFRGTDEKFLTLTNSYIKEGRFINKSDIKESRQVAVIGTKVQNVLGGEKNLLGEYITVRGLAFKVVGIFDDEYHWETNKIFLPLSTAQQIFKGGNTIHDVIFTSGNLNFSETEETGNQIRRRLSHKYLFNFDDWGALHIWRNGKHYERTMSLFTGIRIFIWIVGLGTLFTGIIGVSNIMLIVVKERTKEIGIRKALGARPSTIVTQIVLESLFITGFAGYLGLLLGMGILDLVASKMPPSEFFQNPGVDIRVAATATIVLIITGCLAGYFPARFASRIKPVDVLKDE